MNMHARRIHWMLVATIFLVCFSWGMAPGAASAQSNQHIAECRATNNSQIQAMQRNDYALIISSGKWLLSYCRDLFRGPDDEALMLWGLSYGLLGQRNFEDAIPILERCVAMKPDAADCFVGLGSAYQGLGRFLDARKAFERAISIGGYDEMNAAAVGIAHRLLAELPPENKQTQSDSARDGEVNNQAWEEVPAPPTPTETKKFGTGFFVSSEGHVLTNNHVVAGCRTLTTRDGKPLQVLSRNVDSDLALLLQPNSSQEERKLEEILNHAAQLTNEGRASIWDAYHAKNSKDDFVSMLNKFNLNDDEKQAICDLRFKGSHDEPASLPAAVFRTGPAPKLGDTVVAFGFPLPGVLSSEGNVSTGILSATSGLGDDVRFIQISAPVQPGTAAVHYSIRAAT